MKCFKHDILSKFSLLVVVGCSVFIATVPANADIFGSGPNTFEIEFVTIGDPGNAADTTGSPNPAGAVPYTYRIGKYEISEGMIDAANAIATGEGNSLGITHDGRGPNKPATSVSWFEAAEFVNWLNTSKGSTPAYKFDSNGDFQLWTPADPGYNPNNQFRNTQARYFLPDVDEWYKAAYFDPSANVYFNYPTGSDIEPDGIDFAGDPTFEAVFIDGDANSQPNDITDVGVLSPYGTAGQGGNVFEWEETERDLDNDSKLLWRGIRGGYWRRNSRLLLASLRISSDPMSENDIIGFRVASIPEPSTLLLLCIGTLGSLGLRMRSTAQNILRLNSNCSLLLQTIISK
ncbi:MAG: SUMF1/EgtB/PvdO family nonheme iron enzyme, partial [Planctomycetes bacterium]|nr:SUMF1/EgtB/PvdO family nonheme iron enzyme [Planctomycetota bacterium]